MTPVWALRKLPHDVAFEIKEWLPDHAPCWPNLSPTRSALAIKQLRSNMRLTLETIHEDYSPDDSRSPGEQNGDESFHFAWMEHKRELWWSDPERYPRGPYETPSERWFSNSLL